MTICLARLRAARLTHVSTRPAPERHQTAYVEAHGVRNANDHLEVRLGVRYLAGFLYELQIAAGVRIGPRFLIRIRRGQNHIGNRRCFGQEHILNYDKGFRERKRIDAQTADGIRADDVQRSQFAGLRRVHHLRQAQAFFGRETAPFLLKLICAGDGLVSRQKIGIKPHFARSA